MNWKDANVEQPQNNQLCVVWTSEASYLADGYVIGRAHIYGRPGEVHGHWSVEDGRGGYYPGDHDASDYRMKDTFWYPVLAAPRQ